MFPYARADITALESEVLKQLACELPPLLALQDVCFSALRRDLWKEIWELALPEICKPLAAWLALLLKVLLVVFPYARADITALESEVLKQLACELPPLLALQDVCFSALRRDLWKEIWELALPEICKPLAAWLALLLKASNFEALRSEEMLV